LSEKKSGVSLDARPGFRWRSIQATILEKEKQHNATVLAPRGAAALAATTGVLALSESADAQNVVTTSSGLKYIDVKAGTGASPKTGQTCVMHYTGWLYDNGKKGAKFDSSVDRGEPFEFKIGMGQVIRGWDEGVATMKTGGKRTLIIPPSLGYGARGAGSVIPPNATLLFDVELLAIK
jgi:peptidylprolyl isomerase